MPKSNLTTEILDTFKAKKNVWDTATVLGIDPDIVRYHLRSEKVKLPKGSYSKRAVGKSSSAPISQLHSAIGAKIAFLRMDKNLGDAPEFAAGIGMSAKKYGFIERGQSDPTISDLARVARGLGMDLAELFQPLKFES